MAPDLGASRTLAVLSSGLCFTSLLTVVTLAVILTHWHDALDACSHADCGCLLFARVTTTSYSITGSDVSLCWFAGAAPLPGFVLALAMAAWYGYRGFILPKPHERRAVQVVRGADGSRVGLLLQQRGLQGGGDAAVTLRPSPEASPPGGSAGSARDALWFTTQGVACLLVGLFAVSHVAVLTDGFLSACREYRHAVLKTLKASGSLALLVNERLSCPVIFDFLDYMKPDVREVFQDNHWFPGQRKLATVNTAAALVIALVSAYSTMVLWFALAIKFGRLAQRAARRSKEATQARQSRRSRAHAHAPYPMHCTDL